MGNIEKTAKDRRGLLAWALGVLLLALSARIATTGLFWSSNYHPDETKIIRWVKQVRDDGYIRDRAYPSGWFEMYRAVFWLEDRAGKIRNRWERHCSQDGKVNAEDVGSLSHWHDGFKVEHSFSAQKGRNFNAFLYVVATLFMFGACMEVGMRPLVAFLSSSFFLASAGPIEFLHYCETDEALVATLALFSWLAARSIRIKSPWLAIIGCFAAGFAVSCKFTLMPLLLWCLTAPFVILMRRGMSRRGLLAWIPVMLLCGCAAALCGFAYGTPALRIAPAWYFEAMAHARNHTYAGIVRSLGGDRSKWAADVLRSTHLVREMAVFGWLPLAWGVFAWTFWLRRDFRAQFAGAPFLLPVFVPFLVFLCPFVRNQETLPIAMLISLGAGLPLEWWLRRRHDRKAAPGLTRILCDAAVAVWGITALVHCAVGAAAMSTCFQMRDSRAEAQNWLSRSLPAGTTVGFDSYVGQSAIGVECEPVACLGLSYLWDLHQSRTNDMPELQYYVENVGFTGRLPIRDTRTGRMKPQVMRNLADYSDAIFPLKVWSVSKAVRRPTFGQPVVRLVGFEKPDEGTVDIPIGYGRPIVLLPDGASLYDSFQANGIGAGYALHTVGKRSTANVSFEYGPCWLVTRMVDGAQAVRIDREGLARDRQSQLRPNGAVATQLKRGTIARLLNRAFPFHPMRLRMRGDDQTIVCASFLSHSATDTARELRLGGDPAQALEVLREDGIEDAPSKVEAFLAAKAAGEVPEDDWIAAASSALKACDMAIGADGEPTTRNVSLCGTPLKYAEDFARARMTDLRIEPGKRLPFYLPPGGYDVTISIPQADDDDPLRLPARLLPGQTEDFRSSGADGGATLLTTRLVLRKGCLLKLPGEIDDGSFPAFDADIEVRWSPVAMTLEQAAMVRKALAL